jgi:hypothetical protein
MKVTRHELLEVWDTLRCVEADLSSCKAALGRIPDGAPRKRRSQKPADAKEPKLHIVKTAGAV